MARLLASGKTAQEKDNEFNFLRDIRDFAPGHQNISKKMTIKKDGVQKLAKWDTVGHFGNHKALIFFICGARARDHISSAYIKYDCHGIAIGRHLFTHCQRMWCGIFLSAAATVQSITAILLRGDEMPNHFFRTSCSSKVTSGCQPLKPGCPVMV